MAASPGAAVGRVVFDSPTAEAWADRGEQVILVRRETNPDDLEGMIAADGHPDQPRRQDLPRGRGRPRHGQDLRVRRRGARRRRRGRGPRGSATVLINEGDVISHRRLDRRGLPRRRCRSCRRRWSTYFESGLDVGSGGRWTTRPSRWSARSTGCWPTPTSRRRLASAPTPTPPRTPPARDRLGAAGHRPVPHRAHVPRRSPRVHRAGHPGRARRGRDAALAALLPLQREDFVELLDAMDGLPVTIRLLDPPLHEFLPDLHRARRSGRASPRPGARPTSEDADAAARRGASACTSRTRCSGCAGCASGCVDPRAVRAAGPRHRRGDARDQIKAAGDPQVEIMVPLVGFGAWSCTWSATRPSRSSPRSPPSEGVDADDPDRHDDRAAARRAHRAPDRRGRRLLLVRHQRPHPDDVGLLAATTSRPTFFAAYLDKGVFTVSPFETIDGDGVGRLVQIAAEEGRETKPGHQARRLRRARRRPRIHPLLPQDGAGLRVLLPVPAAGRPARGRPGRRQLRTAFAPAAPSRRGRRGSGAAHPRPGRRNATTPRSRGPAHRRSSPTAEGPGWPAPRR